MNFSYLLIPLLVFLFLPSFIVPEAYKDAVIYLSLVAVFLGGIFLLSFSLRNLVIASSLAAFAFVVNLLPFSDNEELLFLVRMLSLSAFFGWLLFYCGLRMARARRISGNTIYAAINGYLLLGSYGRFCLPPGLSLLSRFLYRSLRHSVPRSMISPTSASSLWPIWGMETSRLSVRPVRLWPCLSAISGELYIAIVIGILVGKFIRFNA